MAKSSKKMRIVYFPAFGTCFLMAESTGFVSDHIETQHLLPIDPLYLGVAIRGIRFSQDSRLKVWYK